MLCLVASALWITLTKHLRNSEGPLPDPLVQAFEKAWEDAWGLVEYFAQDPAWYDPKVNGY
jgi:aflatoxin B1 aldehyde reductase